MSQDDQSEHSKYSNETINPTLFSIKLLTSRINFSKCVKFSGYLICILGKINERYNRMIWNFVHQIFNFHDPEGCSYQIWTVVSHYLLFETIIESTITRPKYIIPPAVSICLPYLQMINYSIVFSEIPDLRDFITNHTILQPNWILLENILKDNQSLKEQIHSHLHKRYSVKKIMSITMQLEYFLKECRSLAPAEYALEYCPNVSRYETFVKDDLKCFQFTIDTVDGGRPKYDLQQLYYWQYPNHFIFRLKFGNIDPSIYRLVIFIHPPYRLPAGFRALKLVKFVWLLDQSSKKEKDNRLLQEFWTLGHSYAPRKLLSCGLPGEDPKMVFSLEALLNFVANSCTLKQALVAVNRISEDHNSHKLHNFCEWNSIPSTWLAETISGASMNVAGSKRGGTTWQIYNWRGWV